LALHDALPISTGACPGQDRFFQPFPEIPQGGGSRTHQQDPGRHWQQQDQGRGNPWNRPQDPQGEVEGNGRKRPNRGISPQSNLMPSFKYISYPTQKQVVNGVRVNFTFLGTAFAL